MKLLLKAFPILSLLILVSEGISTDRGTPWLLSWPFFQNAQAPHSVIEGYGDWCVIDEGVHPGLDFGAVLEDSVLLPTDETRSTFATYATPNAYVVFFGTDSTSLEGWGLAHLDIRSINQWPFTDTSIVMNHQPLAPCSLYSATTPRHMHIQWVEFVGGSPPDPAPGLYNPFDYFENSLAGYDEVQFNHVRWEEFLSPAGNRGIWFTPDNYETYLQLGFAPGNPDRDLFQSILSGAVDIAVAPFSAFQGLPDRDSAGVYSVSYEILRQDPATLEYLPAAPDTGNFGQRWLMEMRDELPNGDSHGYRALFPDGLLLVGGKFDSLWCYNMNAYIVTNSGAAEPSSWANGWSNVYTDTVSSYTNSWSDGICQGAWDTFLAKPNISGAPASNRGAFFPDGRYAVEVTAVSHGSREEGTMMLPVDDLDAVDPSIEGVVVDNFLPSVEAVVVYSYDPAAGPSSVDVKYVGRWEEKNGYDFVQDTEQLVYLEELREELRFFQALERGENAVPPEWLQDDRDSMCELHPAAAGLNNTFECPMVDDTVRDETLSEPDDMCEVGQDPIEFLTGEIARVEAEADSRGFSRKLFESMYGYIPYGGTALRDGETLNMLVFYSEPTSVVDEFGYPITDAVHMEAKMGYSTIWNSNNNGGVFVRDTPAGNAAHADYVEAELGSLFPSVSRKEFAVHYTYQGVLPAEFCGYVRMFIGSTGSGPASGPRDLAFHPIDSSPLSMPRTRAAYESWANLGGDIVKGYDPGVDYSYALGVVHWWFSGGIASAHIGEDVVAELELASLGFQGEYSYLIGDCPFWSGFWVYDDEFGQNGFDVAVVKPDGAVLHHWFSTRFPKGYPSSSNYLWWGGPCYGTPSNPGDILSNHGRYFWLTGGNVALSDSGTSATSDAYAYCVDSWTGAQASTYVCGGSSSVTDDSDIQGPDWAAARIMNVYSNGEALVRYMIPDETEYQWEILSPPGVSEVESIVGPALHEQDNSESAVEADRLFVSVSNPVSDEVEIALSPQLSGEPWSVTVFDISGRQVDSSYGVLEEASRVFRVDTGNLSSGLYLLRIKIGVIETVRSITVVR